MFYFRDFAKYSKGYGSLGVALAFSIWLYWASFVILMGAQFNSRLLQETKEVVPMPGVEMPVAVDSVA
jgi:uncharacterized BrkB/YihY/UPF0761 family membrane protein